MGGRADYEERRNRRIERYNELSAKAEKEADARFYSTANRILQSTPGQPILVGHHSERAHRRLIEKANNDTRKSIELSEKSNYYESKAKSVQNNKAIYNDDPKALDKLKDKLEGLEIQREQIKQREHEQWELSNIGAIIRETKKRIKSLEEQEKIEFIDRDFNGGKIVHNKEINRIQILFDSIPEEDIRDELKHNGFHWSRKEGAWQRLFNEQTIKVTNILMKDVLNNKKIIEEEEEFE